MVAMEISVRERAGGFCRGHLRSERGCPHWLTRPVSRPAGIRSVRYTSSTLLTELQRLSCTTLSSRYSSQCGSGFSEASSTSRTWKCGHPDDGCGSHRDDLG